MRRIVLGAVLAGLGLAAGSGPQPSRTSMRNVILRFDDSLALEIAYLEGRMLPAPGSPVTAIFDDPRSFILEIDSAEVAISIPDLSHLLNRYVFEGSPLKDLKLSVQGEKLKQKGTLHKGVDLPFEMLARLEATPEGKIRIHPTDIKAAHLPVKGLMDLFGVELAGLISTKNTRGVTIREDDIILDPERMLPPPRIKGRLTSIRLERDRVIQVFGSRGRDGAPEEKGNYIAHRGGSLRFGKLTMDHADLTLVDKDPRDPFEFYLAKYQRQLVAGYSKTMPDGGLRTYMPDYNDLAKSK